MLNVTQSASTSGAVKYFEVLMQGDYYLGTDVCARWHGKLATRLGLDTSKNVTKQEFETLLSGKHPKTGKKLSQRMRKDRRPGKDFTFSVPKSVSLAWAVGGDERIPGVLQTAVHQTMNDVEALVHRRVRDGQNANTTNRKQTGNLVYCDFLHQTSRPVDGTVDPHLHVHAFVVNITCDENRFFAAEFAEAMRQLPNLQARFDARLAHLLETKLGYKVERVTFRQGHKTKTGWELKGIQRSTIEKFSRRTAQIEEAALAEGISDASAKSKLGKKTRQEKCKELPLDRLREEWQSRLTRKERSAFAALRAGAIGRKQQNPNKDNRLQAAVDFALEHHLFRQSTVERHQVVATALQHSLSLLPEQIEQELDQRDIIARTVEVNGAARDFLTTPEVLDAEGRMIAFARDGRGTRYKLVKEDHVFKRDWLHDQQKAAVNHVLRSRDTVIAVTGGAGTGKTSLMKETVQAIENNGKSVFTVAPSTGACEVLVKEGFASTKTVEHLLRNTKLQKKIQHGDVILVDESGLLDVRSMNGVFFIAKQTGARVVLVGDARQHSSPRRGEALRLLEKEASLNAVRIHEIQRQKGRYKQAVEMISRGHEIVDEHKQLTGLVAGFDLLDRLGKIKEIPAEERLEILAGQYIKHTGNRKTALVIAPTHAEGRQITDEIRHQLRQAGAIGKKERELVQLRSLHLTDAEKKEASNYHEEGTIVQFHQNAKGGFVRGERYRVHVTGESEVRLRAMGGGGESKPLPVETPDRFEVYREEEVSLAKGDKIRFTLGGTAKDGKRRINNGRLDEVSGFDRAGNIVLKSGMTVDKKFGHLDFGYAITSHASQGKTCDLSIAAMGCESLPAINAKQFYVSVSRGSKDVVIYVDDKDRVRRAIQDDGKQLSATELFNLTPDLRPDMAVRQQKEQRLFLDRARRWWIRHFRRPARQRTARRQSDFTRQHQPPTLAR